MAWHLLKSGGIGEEFGFSHKEFMIDTTDDIANEPIDCGPIAIGSTAHTAGYASWYEKDASGQWCEIVLFKYNSEPSDNSEPSADSGD